MKFELGAGMKCDLAVLLESRMLIQATSGGGKSRTLRRLLEQTHGHVQQIIIDPEGELATLREKFDYVLAAAHGGDTPADPRSAALLAERLLQLEASAIIDLSELKRDPQVDFVKRFCVALIEAPKALRHPVLFPIDEIQLFAPEGMKCDSTLAVIDVATRGRKRGLCLVAATQRISLFDKNAAAPLRNKLIGMTALDTDLKRAGAELGFDKEKTLKLRELESMCFWAFGPALVRAPTLVEVGPHATSHPKAGAKLLTKVPPPTEKIRALLPQLADLPAEAEQKQRSEAELRKELAAARATITRLERAAVQTSGNAGPDPAQLRAAHTETARAQTQVDRLTQLLERLMQFIVEINTQDFFKAGGDSVDQAAIQKVIDAAAQQAVKLVEANVRAQGKALEHWRRRGEQLLAEIHRLLQRDVKVAIAVKHNAPFTVSSPATPARPPARRAQPPVDGEFRISASQQRILNALAWMQTIGIGEGDKTQVALLADQSPTSSAYTNNLGALRTAGLLDYPRPGVVGLTDGGRALADPGQVPTTSEELHQLIYQKLSKSQARILEVVIEVHPEEIAKPDLAERAGASATSSAFTNNLGALRSLKLIDYTPARGVIAQPVLFLDGAAAPR